MDPIAHTFAGAALAAAGLRRATPLAAATLILAANAPDIDIVAQFAGSYASLAHRRGWTHGVLALAVLPFVVAGAVLAWDRVVRRRRHPAAAPPRAGPTLALAALGVASHPALDWLNTYGLRWLMPFDGRWFYGDALFIVDPWMWLLLGGALFLVHTGRPAALAAWTAFAALATLLILATPAVPPAARAVWMAGVLALAATRYRGRWSGASAERLARAAVAATAVYVLGMIALDRAAEAEVRRTLAALGERAGDVMVGPAPANPLAGGIIAAVPGGYRLGDFHWLRRPRVRLAPEPLAAGPRDLEIVTAAARAPAARDFLTWSRFPCVRVRSEGEGHAVFFGDARAHAGQGRGPLAGVTVHLDHALAPVAAAQARATR